MAGYGRISDEEVVEGLNMKFFRNSGIWEMLNHFRDTGLKNRMLKVWLCVHCFIMTPVTLSSIAGPIATEKNLQGLTVILIGLMSTVQVYIKFNFYWSHTEFPCRLIELLKRNYVKSLPSSLRLNADEILRKSAKTANFLIAVVINTNLATIYGWCSTPILRSQFFRCTLGITFFGKPLPGQNKVLVTHWYPAWIDVEETPWTQIVYVYEASLMHYSCFLITAFEVLLLYSVVFLCGQLKVLQLVLSELKGNRDTNLKSKLSECIEEHDKMTRLGHEMRIRLNWMVTLIIGSGYMILISSIFNFFLGSDNGDWVISFRFFVYLAYVLAEVVVYCYASSELEVISEEVGFGAYCSEWNEMDRDARKGMQMIMMRSSRAVVLRACWYPVNIELLNNILQTAYSTSMIMYRVSTDDPS